MWGTKKVETEAPLEIVADSLKTQETNLSKPIPTSREDKAMGAEAVRPASRTPTGATNRLGAGLHIKGEVSGHEDLQVDGILEGLIQLDEGKLTVGAGAEVTADIIASEIVVCGSVNGNLHARNRTEVKKEGSVFGDLTAARILIEDGANLKGAVEIDRKTAEAKSSEQMTYSRSVQVSAEDSDLPSAVSTFG